MEIDTADYFRQKAEQCRRLADMLPNNKDPIVAGLLALAVEFEARAVALGAQEASEAQIGAAEASKEPHRGD